MSSGSSRGFGAMLSDVFFMAGYVKATSSRPLNDCLFTLRDSPRRSTFFGGYNTRLILPKSKAERKEVPFEIEYYRQSSRSSRSTHMVQRLRGVMYPEGGQTHVVAKVKFTGAALLWLWLAIVLTLVGVGLLIYTGNVVMFVLIGLAGSFLLAMILVLWLDRYWLTRMVRRSMDDSIKMNKPV